MFEDFQEKYGVNYTIGQLTPTICALLGLRLPGTCQARAIPEVTAMAENRFDGGKKRKVLIYNPDAVGIDLFNRYPDLLAPVLKDSDLCFASASVMPSVTPVCFGSIFSGAPPEVHGIQSYAKPVLKVETLFDVAAEAGLNAAIVSVNRCSIDTIFRERRIDYYSTRSSRQAFDLTLHLMRHFDYDLLISYNGDYDHSVHHNGGPYSADSLEELKEAVRQYGELNRTADEIWREFDRVTVMAPDHGAHPEGENGTHGADVPEDMLVNHLYRLRAGE